MLVKIPQVSCSMFLSTQPLAKLRRQAKIIVLSGVIAASLSVAFGFIFNLEYRAEADVLVSRNHAMASTRTRLPNRPNELEKIWWPS